MVSGSQITEEIAALYTRHSNISLLKNWVGWNSRKVKTSYYL